MENKMPHSYERPYIDDDDVLDRVAKRLCSELTKRTREHLTHAAALRSMRKVLRSDNYANGYANFANIA
jgi:hypothetical protein